jgi:hypothetical protein
MKAPVKSEETVAPQLTAVKARGVA